MQNDVPPNHLDPVDPTGDVDLLAAKRELHSDDRSIEIINPNKDEEIPED